MAYTPDDLIVIERAIASGTRRVRFSDREVEYQSMQDLMAARSDIAAAVLARISILTTYLITFRSRQTPLFIGV